MSVVPMICVDRVSKTAELLCTLFGWRSNHGGEEFGELVDSEGQRMLWLHTMNAPEHARFKENSAGGLGRGMTLYVFVDDIDTVYGRAQDSGQNIVEDLAKNPNAGLREFTFRDTQGFHFSVSERPSWST